MTVKRLAALSLLITLAVCWTLACSTTPTHAPPQFDAAVPSDAGARVEAASVTAAPPGVPLVVYWSDAGCYLDEKSLKKAVGGTGTGLAQDATVQQIIHLYGAPIPQGGSGTGLCQDASLQALYNLIADAGTNEGGLPPVNLIGDVIGASNHNKVIAVQNQPVEAGTVAGQVWIYNGTTWVPGFLSANDAGVVTMTGDNVGLSSANTNVAMEGQPVEAGTAAGQIWIYNGTAWIPGFVNTILDAGSIILAGDTTGPANANSNVSVRGQPVIAGDAGGQVWIFNGTTWLPGYVSVDAGSLSLLGDVNGVDTSNRIWSISGDGGNLVPIIPSILQYVADAGQPTITQAASTTGSGQTLYIISQQQVDGGADAGLYYSPGGIVLETPAPIGDGGGGILGPMGTIVLQSGAQPYAQFSEGINGSFGVIWLGTAAVAAPTTTNYAIEGLGSNTFVNGTTQVILAIGGNLALSVTTTNVNVVPETILWNSSVTGLNPTLTQATLTSDTPAEELTVQSQGSYPDAGTNVAGADLQLAAGPGSTLNGGAWRSGRIFLDLQTPSVGGTEEYVQVRRGGTDLVQFGALVGTLTSGAIYSGGITPAAGNFALSVTSGGSTTLNTGSGLHLLLDVNAASIIDITGTQIAFKQPVGGASGVNAMQYQAVVVALNSGVANPLTSSFYYAPHIKFTGTLSDGGTSVGLPSSDGACWVLDFSPVVFGLNSITLTANSNTWGTTITLTTSTEFPYVCYFAGPGRLVGFSMTE